MSDRASGDKLSLEVLVSDGGLKIFIYDFNKGVTTLSHGIKDKQSKYILQGERNAGHINLVRNNTIDYTLWVVNNYTGGNGDSDKSSPVLCALCEGQILIIECKKTFIRKPLRLDELRFEYN
ncbi:hypothetical protein [Klebsiella variicola]|uniref:hypothetical protein n=1 Tax=Klebsiella variicola TaxID=244366 RepID=UPI00164C6975|nr:hypothetical protein [Klebsiella variicola]MBC5378555.1 hypothetical protein [Klebsiella variicola]HBX0883768.1 hypothetical protein [Klebsiella pneumoniae]HCB0988702.1 hypothetical protein [Klebsiella variicola subsp. variicola]HDG7986169.1 hypothetical protein [Klebsiella quasipneumoniae]